MHHYAAIVASHDGLYQLQDPTFGGHGGQLVTARAIDEEGSGYFLVPTTGVTGELSASLRIVDANSSEAKAVYGMGNVFNVPPGMEETADVGTCSQCGNQRPPSGYNDDTSTIAPQPQVAMTVASARMMAVSLTLTDTPLGYKPQKGPAVYETLNYNARDGDQPANFLFSNVGPQWTHSWQAYIQDDPNHPGSSTLRVPSGGGGYDYSLVQTGQIYNSSTGAFVPETYDNSQLYRYPPTGSATSYVRYLPMAVRKSTAILTALLRIQGTFF